MTLERYVEGEAAMEALGAELGRAATGGGWIYLHGDLGAGKTTLVRGLLRGLGHEGAVKSPTYTLVEPYELAGRAVYHLDLYRLGDAEELEWIGIREIFAPGHLCLVEWPERGRGVLPEADLQLELEYAGAGRRVRAEGLTERGRGVLEGWLGVESSN
jgi:tRNA threonylcarbamoyladenosine biosynthesis protein TsaE